jgi:uncharacterized protein (DUF1778 family)
MKQKTVPLLVRIRPSSKQLLEKAAEQQRRSQASLVDTLIVDNLSREFSDTDDRLNKFLNGAKDVISHKS